MTDAEKECLAIETFKRAVVDLVSAARPVARFGDGNCGYVIQEVISSLREAGLYAYTPATKRKKAVIPQSLRQQVFERDAYRCLCCGSHLDLRADHVVPESEGGAASLENLQTLCLSCNSRKGTKTIDYRASSVRM
ncbi:HNH endonuclease [Ralstonia thomasii]|uniref:HNH endonuclease n=1 Tax=Ralstonia thomasii TaxID=3058596 RepID=UPI00292E5327|nr:HNH endonuclease [Ralstonia sp. LMG 18095]